MTNFFFSLQKVLDWRRKQLDGEEAKLRQAAAALSEVDRARAEMETGGLRAEVEVRRRGAVAGLDLHALGNYRLHVRSQMDALAARRTECAQQVAAQQASMLESRRRLRLLERLRERREAQWKAAQDRELEALASESYMAQWRAPSSRGRDGRARL